MGNKEGDSDCPIKDAPPDLGGWGVTVVVLNPGPAK